jgi:hypothetical protein
LEIDISGTAGPSRIENGHIVAEGNLIAKCPRYGYGLSGVSMTETDPLVTGQINNLFYRIIVIRPIPDAIVTAARSNRVSAWRTGLVKDNGPVTVIVHGPHFGHLKIGIEISRSTF